MQLCDTSRNRPGGAAFLACPLDCPGGLGQPPPHHRQSMPGEARTLAKSTPKELPADGRTGPGVVRRGSPCPEFLSCATSTAGHPASAHPDYVRRRKTTGQSRLTCSCLVSPSAQIRRRRRAAIVLVGPGAPIQRPIQKDPRPQASYCFGPAARSVLCQRRDVDDVWDPVRGPTS